jgi:hypothetical protein
MKNDKKGIGVGSASIVLVFAVLCLAIFAVISFASAISNRALIKVEENLVRSYYEADVLAEYVFAEILKSDADSIPDNIRGVEIISGWDWDLDAETVSFSCGISDKKELYVVIAVHETEMDILEWRMRDVGEWETDDDPLNLFDDFDFNIWSGD